MAVRAAVNQQIQLALETTPGTAVAASKLLESMTLDLSPKVQTKDFHPQGRKHASQVLIEKEWCEAKASGIGDYQGLAYPLSVFGAPVVTTVFTSATQRVYTPVLTGNQAAQTFTVQKGESGGTGEQIAYALFNSFSFKADRQQVTWDANILSQSVSTGVTMTASPTIIAAQPILASQMNVYLDSTSGGIGTTQLNDTYETNFAYSNVYGARWPISRANASFAGHVDLAPKGEVKLKMMADAVANAQKTALENGATQYLRIDFLGGTVGAAGNYKLTFDVAVRVSNIASYSAVGEVYCVEYTYEIVEDPSWGANGTVMTVTLVNNLPSI